MTPERWREVKSVLGDALEVATAERRALLDRACGTDAALRTEVESLLAAAGDADSLPAVRAAIAGEAAAVAARGDADGDAGLRGILESALGAQYDVVRPLGHGGMGAVYLAWERALERFVAIKVLRPDLADERESRERFRREARVAAQLSHPGILPLYAFGEVRGLWYFVMGYVRGETLAQRLRRQGRLPVPEARRILADLADALACAHRHGVVHRDVKPANVLLDELTGRAVLADFGISKAHGGDDSLTASGAVLGTPRYMSPEQAAGAADVDARSDVWSLGAVAYAMLAGREPFAVGVAVVAGATGDVHARRPAHDPPPLHHHVAAVPGDLAAVVMRCLAHDRALRWPDARSLGDALARTSGEPMAAASEALRDVSGLGPYALVWALAWSALAALTTQSVYDRLWLLLVALLVPVALVLRIWNVEHHGLTPLEFARLAFCPPRWWGMWWPRALRRPGDLWSRLPRPARLVRRLLTGVLVALPAMMLARRWLAADGALPGGPALQAPDAVVERGLVLCVAAVTAGALAWALARGLSLREAVHLLFGATMPSPGWRAPAVARLLAPAWREVRPPASDDAADHARAIGELARLLPASLAADGDGAARAADRVVAAAAECDRELAALARDAGPGETARLTAQLGALEAEAGEHADHAELRELLRRQLELVQRMRARRESVLHARIRLLDLLRALWTQLCLVHGTAATVAAIGPEVAARLRALCTETADLLGADGSAGGAGRW